MQLFRAIGGSAWVGTYQARGDAHPSSNQTTNVPTQNTTATNIANGANYTVNTLPKYKNVYIWERVS